MTSLYETNILNQPSTWKQLLNSSMPIELIDLQANRIIFIGIGSSFWIARIAEFLWREYNTKTTIRPCSVQSFDLVKSKYVISDNDIVVVFSHRGTKTFSVKALELAKNNGATTILITGIGSPQMTSNREDYRIETCAQENCGAFTISLTSALTRIIQWIGMDHEVFLERFKETINTIEMSLPYKVHIPKFPKDLVIVGNLIHEIVAHEVALKISETSYLPVRSFGLEEILHGPRVTLDNKTSLIILSSMQEPRRQALINYAQAIGCELLDVPQDQFGLPKEFGWLAQLLWGQQLALELSKTLKTNPDTVRGDQPLYNEARRALTL